VGTKVEPLSPRTEETKQSRLGFIRELKEELKKVTWTTKDELIFCTKIVVGSTFILGIGIYLIDLVIKGALNGFGALFRLIFG
jgi:preprotein translocase subunit SecE